jgi:hypothetical protein
MSIVPSLLAMIRDESLTIEQLAAVLRQSVPFVAGAVHAVTGNADWAHNELSDGAQPGAAERGDYDAGRMFGEMLMDEPAMDIAHGLAAEWWRELDAEAGRPGVA